MNVGAPLLFPLALFPDLQNRMLNLHPQLLSLADGVFVLR
jgi:folate-dependent phosphoribosylglycinamide formyltransferase PurN